MGGGRWEGGTKWKGHVYTYDRFMLMHGKKKSQYCKVIILQFKIKYKKKFHNYKCWRRCEEKGTLSYYWRECKLVQPLWRTVCGFLKKLEIELHMTLQSHSWAYIWRKNMIQKDTHTSVFIAALLTIARTWKQPKCPSTEEWIKKMWYMYSVEYYSAIKKNQTLSFAATQYNL